MLYWLAAFSDTIGPLNVLRYITFRTGGAMITALALVLFLAPAITAMLHRRWGRSFRPAGLTILASLLVAALLWANPVNGYVWIVLAVTLAFGAIGFCDDYLDASRRTVLSDKVRMAIMASIGLAACLALVRFGRPPTATLLGLSFRTELAADLGWFYVAVGALIIVAAGTIVNLAERLNGFAIVPAMIAAGCFGILAWMVGNAVFSDYLQLHFVSGTSELAVLCGAVVGAGIGFLWFNAPPASILVGDTGSLALGGMFGTVAVATKHEIVLALICCLFALKPTPARG
jgi:phospho-N-acetylmuramoyl-pentapeptide-transferase